MGIGIRSDFPNAVEKYLLEQVCVDDNIEADDVFVSSLPRFGNTGARLLIVYFAKKPEGTPYLLKVSKTKKIEREWAGVKAWRHHHKDLHIPCKPKFTPKGPKWGGILYPHQGADKPTDKGVVAPKSFREVLFNSKFTPNELSHIVDVVFESMDYTYLNITPMAVTLRTFFKPYFRNGLGKIRVARTIGTEARVGDIKFLGFDIRNPLVFFKKLPKRFRAFSGIVHGDLHTDNIILGTDKKPHLIDFEWAKYPSDVLIDHVLLETSIRFKDFPQSYNLYDQGRIDEMFLIDPLTQTVTNGVINGISDRDTRQAYRRIVAIVRTIRHHARKVHPEFTIEHYLLIQFIVLLGLLKYESLYPSHVCTRYLGMIAKRLQHWEGASDVVG